MKESWVVYLMTVRLKPEGMRAVCEQSEWEAMEQMRPGYHKLIQAGIANECEAEQLARGNLGGDFKTGRHKIRAAKEPINTGS